MLQIIGLAVQVRRPNSTAADASSVRLIRFWAIGLVSPPEKAFARQAGAAMRGSVVELSRPAACAGAEQAAAGPGEPAAAGAGKPARRRPPGTTPAVSAGVSKNTTSTSTVPAQVIGTGGTDQSRVLYIDKGAKDGLQARHGGHYPRRYCRQAEGRVWRIPRRCW